MISDADLVTYLRAHEDDLPTLRSLEKAAIAAIQKRTGRYFGPEAEIVETVPYRGRVLPLANPPIENEITTIESWDGSAWVAESSLSYFVGFNGVTFPSTTYATGAAPSHFRVTYNAGYVQLEDPNEWEAPEDVKQAVLLQVKMWFDDLGPSDIEATQQAINSLLEVHMRLAA